MQDVFLFENIWFDAVDIKIKNLIKRGYFIRQFQVVYKEDNVCNLVVLVETRELTPKETYERMATLPNLYKEDY